MTPSSQANPTLLSPWGPHTLGETGILALRVGPRDLWMKRIAGEIWVAQSDQETGVATRVEAVEGEPDEAPPDPAGWARWATAGEEHELQLRPSFPDRALVLSPEHPFRLLPRARARIFVRVPLWIRIELVPSGATDPGEAGVLLTETPSVTMSDTWWGDFLSGELCYWLPTTARREMAPELFMPYLAVCPLVLENEADNDLEVQKLAFRVAHLSLFSRGSEFWADETRVRYQGDELGSHIDMTGRPPPEAQGARLIGPPREPAGRGLRARTFERLRGLPGLGGGV